MACFVERDTEFCFGTEDDELEAEDGLRSPTDVSEDSVDVRVKAITVKNKRKCSEPKKVDMNFSLKKNKSDLSSIRNVEAYNCNPFRPWSASSFYNPKKDHYRTYSSRVNLTLKINVKEQRTTNCLKNSNGFDYLSENSLLSSQNINAVHNKCITRRFIHQNVSSVISTFSKHKPLTLVSKGVDILEQKSNISTAYFRNIKNYENEVYIMPSLQTSAWNYSLKNLPKLIPSKIKFFKEMNKNGSHLINEIKFSGFSKSNIGKRLKLEVKTKTDSAVLFPIDNKYKINKRLSLKTSEKRSGAPSMKSSQGNQQKNYKNMTRERRIEANARERTRVHTISAAFDTLRRSIPSYSHNQKLSKLSVLRIACSYIITLSRLAGYDYSKDQNEPDLSNCIEKVSKTIQAEGKIRKKREG